MTTTNKIKYGNVEIDDSEFEPRNVKERITTFIDGDVLNWLKAEAKDQGTKYQTHLNSILRKLMNGDSEHQKQGFKDALREMIADGELIFRSKNGNTIRKGDALKKAVKKAGGGR